MKRYLLVSLSVVLFVVAGYYLSQHLYCVPEESDPDGTARSVLLWNQCLQCHSQAPSLPFYASFPVISKLLARDVEQGYLHADLKPFMELMDFRTQLPEAMLAKIEQTLIEGSMPPITYSAVHWGKGVNRKEKALLLDWIYKKREVYYVSGLAAESHRYAMVQPLFDSLTVNHPMAELGEKLFHDVRLSVDNTVSCATCHGLHTGGVDRKPVSEGIRGLLGDVNAPTVFNSAYNLVQFWDGRAVDLQEQAAGPPLNPVEMGSVSWDSIVAKFSVEEPFTQQFLALFPEGLTEKSITAAIAEFEKIAHYANQPFGAIFKWQCRA
ncbi:MAG: cytochrome c peroxidase, partial [Bacteroidales bacterium]